MELQIDLEKGRKSVARKDGDTTDKETKLDKDVADLGLENFKHDLIVTQRVKKSLDNPDGDPWIQEFLDIEKSIIQEWDTPDANKIQKANNSHLPSGSERYAYKPSKERNIVYIPVNRLKQVYQTDEALNRSKINENKRKMSNGEALDPIQIGYNYDVHDGHHRWEAAKESGHSHVPCEVVGSDPDKVKEARESYKTVWKSEDELDYLKRLKDIDRALFGNQSVEIAVVLDINKAMHMLHKGKLIKRRVPVKGKNGQVFYRMQWIDPNKENPKIHKQFGDDRDNHTTFRHDDKIVKEIERRQSSRFPVVHVPVDDVKNRTHTGWGDSAEEHKHAVNQAIEKYKKGEAQEPLRLNDKGQVVRGHELIDMAKKMGLTHLPAIIMGNPELKKELENKYKDEVMAVERDEHGRKYEVPAAMRGQGPSVDGTYRGQHMKPELSVEYQDAETHFKKYTLQMFTKGKIMDYAENQGVNWKETTDPKTTWINAYNAIMAHISKGEKFVVPDDAKDTEKRMKQLEQDGIHPFFLRFCNKFNFDRDKIMEWCRTNDVKWKEKSDPTANWLYCAKEIKHQLGQGKMLNGVRTRQQASIQKTTRVISDAVKEQVKSLRKKYGDAAIEDRALELGIDINFLDKKGQDIPYEDKFGNYNPIRRMRVHTAIQEYMADGNNFTVGTDDYGTEGRVAAERGDYGDVDLSKLQRIAMDTSVHNTKEFEERSRTWALQCIALDHDAWEQPEEAKRLYSEFVDGARKSRVMIHVDPLEVLDSGTGLLEQYMSDGSIKSDYELGRVADKDHRDINERDIFGDEFDDAKDHERPVYGVMDLYSQGLAAANHGDIAFVLKDDIKKRSTVTPVDSNNIPYGKEGKWVFSAQDPHHLVVRRWINRWMTPKNPDAKRERMMDSVASRQPYNDDKGYFETQILGGVDFNRDVDHVLVPNRYKEDGDYADHHEMVKMFADLFKLPIKYE
jgi:hypothetical protein